MAPIQFVSANAADSRRRAPAVAVRGAGPGVGGARVPQVPRGRWWRSAAGSVWRVPVRAAHAGGSAPKLPSCAAAGRREAGRLHHPGHVHPAGGGRGQHRRQLRASHGVFGCRTRAHAQARAHRRPPTGVWLRVHSVAAVQRQHRARHQDRGGERAREAWFAAAGTRQLPAIGDLDRTLRSQQQRGAANTGIEWTPEIPPTRPQPPAARPPTTTTAPATAPRTISARIVNPSTPLDLETARRASTNSTVGSATSGVIPSVFVDVPSSDEDMDSDTTDPMVEHLFYSPKTPRIPASAASIVSAPTTTSSAGPSRKRPRSPSVDQRVETAPAPHNTAAVCATTTTTMAERAHGSAVIKATSVPTPPTTSVPLDSTLPFQYFTARLPSLSASLQSSATARFQIRACIKSVVGFQFNTGRYQLRVSVEDCTATKEADVAEDFVTRLMGVPCSEFLQTMQTKVQVAHGWAATMQFALMNLEGVMTFERSAAASTPGSAPLLLIDCRDFQSSDTQSLLQRVKTSLSRAPR
ncbi:hypothetical protein ON010_g5930 [Phytophthora cinnamomi]|nr:hypothetical protein ON010_g5930 [Phytophthora cinnamomi]